MRLTLWAAAACLLAAGCGDNHPVYPVRGRVEFDGRPLPGGGAIAFVPLGKTAGKAPGGTIAADGTYRLSTYGTNDGSMPGEFRVVVMQETDREPEATPDGERPSRAPTSLPAADRIPKVYADFNKSPLRGKVEPKGDNEINIVIPREPPAGE